MHEGLQGCLPDLSSWVAEMGGCSAFLTASDRLEFFATFRQGMHGRVSGRRLWCSSGGYRGTFWGPL